MTDTRRKGFIIYLFAGILAMLAVTLYARLTEPSLVQHSHTQAVPAQENTMPQSEIGRLMLSLQENPNDPAALIALGSSSSGTGSSSRRAPSWNAPRPRT
jgi:cytochrome c-type biogenesis protein CcmH/NrfG